MADESDDSDDGDDQDGPADAVYVILMIRWVSTQWQVAWKGWESSDDFITFIDDDNIHTLDEEIRMTAQRHHPGEWISCDVDSPDSGMPVDGPDGGELPYAM